MSDTHFYHEFCAGRLPDTTPKRIVDDVLSTLTPYGVSFFCYGFMAEELPLWKKELNPGAPVFAAYQEPHTVAARREMSLKAMEYVEQLRPWLEGTRPAADAAIYYPERINEDFPFGSYPLEHGFGIYELFNAAAIPVRIVNRMPEDPAEVKCIVLDSLPELPETEMDALRKYLAAGGKAILIGKCTDALSALCGIHIRETDAPYVSSGDDPASNGCLIRLPKNRRHYTEEKGEAVLRYHGGEPAATRVGNVIYFGASDAIDDFTQYRNAVLGWWWKKFFTDEGLHSGVEYHNNHVFRPDGNQFASADIFAGEGKHVLLLRNFGVEQHNAAFRWSLPENMEITEICADGEKLPLNDAGTLPRFQYYAAILAEERK